MRLLNAEIPGFLACTTQSINLPWTLSSKTTRKRELGHHYMEPFHQTLLDAKFQ